jgi:hypothetical protein
MELPLYAGHNPRSEQISKHVQFQYVFPSGECQIVVYSCVLWHNLRNHCLVVLLPYSTKVPSYLKTMIEDLIFWYHTNKIHTHINQIAVTAKTLSQPGIQLCVPSVAVHHGKQTFMGCMRDFPGLFNIQVWFEHRSYFDSWNWKDTISVTLWYSKPVIQPGNVQVFSNRWHCPLSACSTSVAVRLYRGNGDDVSDDTAILSDKNWNKERRDLLQYLT